MWRNSTTSRQTSRGLSDDSWADCIEMYSTWVNPPCSYGRKHYTTVWKPAHCGGEPAWTSAWKAIVPLPVFSSVYTDVITLMLALFLSRKTDDTCTTMQSRYCPDNRRTNDLCEMLWNPAVIIDYIAATQRSPTLESLTSPNNAISVATETCGTILGTISSRAARQKWNAFSW